jgi:tRNA modification GTPase
LEFAGIPVEVVDTAGLRDTGAGGGILDQAEAMGVAKSREAMAEADVVLLVVAADASLDEEDRAVMRALTGDARMPGAAGLVVAVNKVDLLRAEQTAGGPVHSLKQERDRWNTELFADLPSGSAVVETSALEDTGTEELRAAVLAQLKAIAPGADTAPVTNLRQQQAVGGAASAVRAAMAGVENAVPHEMVLIDLYEALGALDGLTGTTHTEEILGLIFARFCIGK